MRLLHKFSISTYLLRCHCRGRPWTVRILFYNPRLDKLWEAMTTLFWAALSSWTRCSPVVSLSSCFCLLVEIEWCPRMSRLWWVKWSCRWCCSRCRSYFYGLCILARALRAQSLDGRTTQLLIKKTELANRYVELVLPSAAFSISHSKGVFPVFRFWKILPKSWQDNHVTFQDLEKIYRYISDMSNICQIYAREKSNLSKLGVQGLVNI